MAIPNMAMTFHNSAIFYNFVQVLITLVPYDFDISPLLSDSLSM